MLSHSPLFLPQYSPLGDLDLPAEDSDLQFTLETPSSPLGDLDLPAEDSDLQFTLETLVPLPDIDGIDEDDEMETGYLHDETISSPSLPPRLDVNISRMSDLDTTRLQLDSLRKQ